MTVTEVADLDMVSQPECPGALAAGVRDRHSAAAQDRASSASDPQAASSNDTWTTSCTASTRAGSCSELVYPETGTVLVAFQQALGTWFVPSMIGRFRAEHHGCSSAGALGRRVGSSLLSGGAARPHSRPGVPGTRSALERLFAQPCFSPYQRAPRGRPAGGRASSRWLTRIFVSVAPRRGPRRSLSDELVRCRGFTPRSPSRQTILCGPGVRGGGSRRRRRPRHGVPHAGCQLPRAAAGRTDRPGRVPRRRPGLVEGTPAASLRRAVPPARVGRRTSQRTAAASLGSVDRHLAGLDREVRAGARARSSSATSAV